MPSSHGGPHRRKSCNSDSGRLPKRLSRLLARQSLAFGAALVLIVATGFVSNRSPVVERAAVSVSGDIVGRASVIDGDTFETRGQRIRIWGIDSPESAQLCHTAGKPWRCGQQAALALSDHLGQRTVVCVERDRDRYGRIVGKCSVAGQDIGAWLVSNGWALDWATYSGGSYSSHQATAERAKSGIWRGAFDKPWEWRRAKR